MPGINGVDRVASRNMRENRMRRDRALGRLSSGKRINKASDDAAGLAIAARMSSQISSLGQGMRNINDGISLTRVAEGALNESTTLIGRMRELSIQSRNGTLSDVDRATIQQEYDSLAEEVTRISSSTEFNGKNLLDGSLSGSGAITIENGQDPEASSTEIEVADSSAAALGVAGLSVSNPNTIQTLDLALDRISRTRAGLGSTENRLVSQISQIGQARENTSAARSRIEDADIAVELSELIKSRILETGQFSIASQSKLLSRRSLMDILKS